MAGPETGAAGVTEWLGVTDGVISVRSVSRPLPGTPFWSDTTVSLGVSAELDLARLGLAIWMGLKV